MKFGKYLQFGLKFDIYNSVELLVIHFVLALVFKILKVSFNELFQYALFVFVIVFVLCVLHFKDVSDGVYDACSTDRLVNRVNTLATPLSIHLSPHCNAFNQDQVANDPLSRGKCVSDIKLEAN